MADDTTSVGKIGFELTVDGKKLSTEIAKSCNEVEEKVGQSFENAGKAATEAVESSNAKIREILSDQTRSMKSKAASIASLYKKEGFSASDSMKKAWSLIERSAKTSAEEITQAFAESFDQIEEDASQAEAGISQKLLRLAKKVGAVSKNVAQTGGSYLAKQFSAPEVTSDSGKRTSGFSGFVKKAGTALAGAFAVKRLADFGKQCIELGSDLAEVQNVVDVTFSSMSAKVDTFAKSAAKSFGLSETMAKQYAGTFGAMAKAFGFTEQQAYDMSTALTGLAGDVASFYNLDQSEAYTKLKSVFTGETESLKDIGIVMTQTSLDSYALAQGFGKTTSAMTEQEKVALRSRFVLDQLSLAQGDFARTSDSWANQSRLMALQTQSIMASIGQGLINLFTPVIKTVNVVLGKIAQLAEAFKGFTELITGKKSEGGSGITDSLTSGLGDATAAAGDAGSGLASAADQAGNLADNAGAAGTAAKKAAKEMRTLMGFDEINKLAEQTDTSGDSGGGSGSGSNPGSGGSGGGSGLAGLGSGATNFGKLAEGENSVDKLSKSLDKLLKLASPTLRAMKKLYNEGFQKLEHFTWGTIKDFWNNFLKPMGSWMLSDNAGLPRFFNITNDLLNEIDWDRLQTSLAKFYTSLQGPAKFKWTDKMNFYNSFLRPLATWTMSSAIPQLVDELTKFNNKVDWNFLNGAFERFYAVLAKMVKGIGQGVIDFIKNFKITDGLAKVVNLFAAALKTFAGVLDLIPAPVLNAIGQALGAVAVSVGAFLFYTSVGATLTKIGAGLTKFVAAATAHPLLVIASGLTTLALAIIGFASAKYEEQKYGPFREDIETLSKSLTECSSTIKSKMESIKESLDTAGLAESQQIKDLWEEYQTLADKAGKSADEEARMKDIVEMMADICPKMNEYVNEQTGLFTAQKDEISALVDQTEEYYKKQAAQSLLTDAYEAQAQAILGIKSAQEELNVISETYNNLVAQYNEEMAKTEPNIGLLESLSEQMYQCRNSQDELNTSLSEVNQAYMDATSEIGTLTEYVGGLSTAADSINMRQSVINIATAIDEMDGILVDGEQVIGEDAIKIYEAFADELDKAPDYCYTTADGMMVQFGAGIEDGRYIPQSTLSSVLSQTDEEMKSWYSTWKGNGTNMLEGYKEGVLDMKDDLNDTFKNVAKDTVTAFREEAEIHSPSKKTERDGEYMIEGLVNGVTNAESKITDLMGSLPGKMVRCLGDLVATFAISGALIPAGLLAGFTLPWLGALATFKSIPKQIKDAIGDLAPIGRNAAQALANGFRSVHIPSPRFSVGTVATSAAGVGFSLPDVKVAWLAQGGFVKKNTPQLAMIGDNRHQGEVVAPEGKLLEMAKMAASSAGSPEQLQRIINLLETLISLVQGGDDIVLAVDGEELARAMITGSLRLKRRHSTVTVTV